MWTHRPGHHGALDEGEQAVRGHVLDASQADAADAATALLGRHRNNSLGLGLPAPFALFGATDVGFIDLDAAGEAIAARPDHRPTQLVEPGPGRLVAAQPEHPLQAQGADAVLLAGDEPHRQEPHPQRLACVLKHRAGRQRCAPTTTPAPQQPIRHRPRLPDHAAVRAGEAIRPTESPDILPASRVAAEPLVHLLERPWVINPTDRMLCAVHPLTLPSPRRSVKGIPIC